jgi:allergen V5/tpx-1 related
MVTSRKTLVRAGATVAVGLVAGGALSPVIAEELDPSPTAVVAAGDTATAGTNAEANTSDTGTSSAINWHLTDGGVVYSSDVNTRFTASLQASESSSDYQDVVIFNDSDVVSPYTFVSLDALRNSVQIPEGLTFGNPAGSSGEVAKGSRLIETGLASADTVEPDKDYWFIGEVKAHGTARITLTKKAEPAPEPTPAPTEDTTPAPTPDPTPSPEPEKKDDSATPAPTEDATPAPKTEEKKVEEAKAIQAEVSKKADAAYRAPAQADIPNDNATRHDTQGRVVSTAPVESIKTDASTGITVTRFTDGGSVTTNDTGEVVESTLGGTVTNTGTPVVSAVRTSTPDGTPVVNTSAVKGQTLRTGAAGVANIGAGISPAAIPFLAAGLSAGAAGILIAGSRIKRSRKSR